MNVGDRDWETIRAGQHCYLLQQPEVAQSKPPLPYYLVRRNEFIQVPFLSRGDPARPLVALVDDFRHHGCLVPYRTSRTRAPNLPGLTARVAGCDSTGPAADGGRGRPRVCMLGRTLEGLRCPC